MAIRREWKIRIVWLLLGLALGSIPQCSTFWDTDRCLDNGGRWDDATQSCTGARTNNNEQSDNG